MKIYLTMIIVLSMLRVIAHKQKDEKMSIYAVMMWLILETIGIVFIWRI